MKRNNDPASLKDVLGNFIKHNRLEKGIDNIDIKDAWQKLMSNGVSQYTSSIQLKNGTLYISLTSSVLREELSYGKQKIIDLLNEELGKDVVKKLILR